MSYAKEVMQRRLEIIGHLRVQCCSEHHWPTFLSNLEEADQIFTIPQLIAMREILFVEFNDFRKETEAHKRKVSMSVGYVPRSEHLETRKKSKMLARTLASMTKCYGLVEKRLKEYGFEEPSPRQILEESLKVLEKKISFFGGEGEDASVRRNKEQVVIRASDLEGSIDKFAELLKKGKDSALQIQVDRRPIGLKGLK